MVPLFRSASRLRRRALGLAGVAILGASLLLAPSLAAADEYDPQRAGHPARVIAYFVHPVGVVLDVLVFRPGHWLVSQPGLDEFFGHEPYDD